MSNLKRVFVKVIFTCLGQKRGFAIRARPYDSLKNVKAKIMKKIHSSGIMLKNSRVVKVVGMKAGQQVKDLNKKLLHAYQVIGNDKNTFCHLYI